MIPAVTHVDYSARLQTVDPQRHGRLHKLLEAFDARTGCPVMINTSFNVRGEPIVCTPQDAINTFLNTGIDVVVMSNYLVTEKPREADYEAGMQRSVALEAAPLTE